MPFELMDQRCGEVDGPHAIPGLGIIPSPTASPVKFDHYFADMRRSSFRIVQLKCTPLQSQILLWPQTGCQCKFKDQSPRTEFRGGNEEFGFIRGKEVHLLLLNSWRPHRSHRTLR